MDLIVYHIEMMHVLKSRRLGIITTRRPFDNEKHRNYILHHLNEHSSWVDDIIRDSHYMLG